MLDHPLGFHDHGRMQAQQIRPQFDRLENLVEPPRVAGLPVSLLRHDDARLVLVVAQLPRDFDGIELAALQTFERLPHDDFQATILDLSQHVEIANRRRSPLLANLRAFLADHAASQAKLPPDFFARHAAQ